jgi:rhizosphere induced protein
MSDYSLQVANKSGASQNIAIYQVYPSLSGGLPLVWIVKNINNENTNTFSWEVDWALNWGTTAQVLKPGVMWESGGTPRAVEPNKTGGNNKIGVYYTNGDFASTNAYNDSSIQAGSMDVSTDQSFTVEDSLKMSISVYMNGSPTFAMQGKPNGLYQFDTHPTYYLCTTDSKQGVAVSGNFVSSVKEVVFENGITSLSYVLTETLEFVEA